MTRHDAGVVLWAAAGLFAIWSGASGLFVTNFALALSPATYRSVMSGGPDVVRMLLASMVLLSLMRLAAGVLLLRRRAALADWLFPKDDAPAAGPRGATAHEICAVAVAGVGLWVVLASIEDLSVWLEGRVTHRWSGATAISAMFVLLLGSLGWLVLRSRQRIAAWVLQRHSGAPGPAAVETAGITLFGLFLILWHAPRVGYDILLLVTAGGASPAFVKSINKYDVEAILKFLLGSILFLGSGGPRSLWLKLRSKSEDEDDVVDVSPAE